MQYLTYCQVTVGQISHCSHHETQISNTKCIFLSKEQRHQSTDRIQLNDSVKELNISIFFFPPITQWCYISDVLFTGGREVSDVSVLKYY